MSATPTNLSVLRGSVRPDFLREESLATILRDTCARWPDRPAIRWENRTTTYRELDARSDAIAGALARRGAAPGRVVGLFMSRGADALVAQAAIAKSGAAWLPLDPEMSIARVHACLELGGAMAAVCDRRPAVATERLRTPIWLFGDLSDEPDAGAPAVAAAPSDPAYVIFTSGSTGQPKGIAISQRSICHLLRAENDHLGVTERDVVYQGFSLAFDMSCEEIWIAYLAGASLWIAPPGLAVDPSAVGDALARESITVLHAVPSLADLIPKIPTSVRLVNLGGEACSSLLVDRLLRAGHRVFNSYGPTETTVTATIAELRPGRQVSIGRPLAHSGLAVIDPDTRKPVALGEEGELAIFGPGVAIGYVGLPEPHAARFVQNPVALDASEARMFLTGDRGFIDGHRMVCWVGRADDQIKIRGYRVELGEIGAALARLPGIAAATSVVRSIAGIDRIVGFLVARKGEPTDAKWLRELVAQSLPPYMVPAYLEFLSALPRLPSGKIDVHSLQERPLTRGGLQTALPASNDEHEVALFAVITELFPAQAFVAQDDFFDDLGGHSLLAARLVSQLRRDRRYAALSVHDVYAHRRLDAIAAAMGRLAATDLPPAALLRSRAPVPFGRRIVCGLAQAAATPFFVLVTMADWLAPFFVYHNLTGDEGDSVWVAAGSAVIALVVTRMAVFAIAIGGKRLIAGKLQAGRVPLWGPAYFRWWLSTRFVELPDTYLIAASPWMTWYLRALGARVGDDVLIDTITVGAPELVTLESGVSLGTFVNVENARVEGGELVLGAVHLAADAVVDSYSVLEEDTGVGRGARLCPQSTLGRGRRIPDGEIWDGTPATRSSQADEPLPARPMFSRTARATHAVVSLLTAAVIAILFFLPIFPAFIAIDWLDVHTWNVYDSSHGVSAAFGLFLVLALGPTALLVALTIAGAAVVCRLLPRQTVGRWPVHGLAFWRKRVTTLLVDASFDGLHGLYASIYAPFWLRCLGARVASRAEISTAEGMVPQLLSVGAEAFVGDGAVLGDEELRGGWMVLKPTRVGDRSFIGNGAYVPDGTVIPNDVLIGVQTRAPRTDEMAPDQTWIGSPPVLVPARARSNVYPDELTFRPSAVRQMARGMVEIVRIILPQSMIIAAGYVIVRLVMPYAEDDEWLAVAMSLAGAGCVFGFASFASVVALKWLVVGRYRPREAPMWTLPVWLSEAVTNVYESIAVPNFVDILRGTPMLPWALRLLGTHVGRGTFINTTDITEFDCVTIGAEAELNAWCGPQTHLFEDRVMKIGRVDIGSRVTIGARTTVLYGSRVGADVRLGPLTLVSKGEDLPDGSRWEGTPARVMSSTETR